MNNQAVEDIKRADLASMEFSELVRLVKLAFHGLRSVGSLIDPPKIICRARCGSNPFHHRDQISYNQKFSAAGRCNPSGQSLFYAASSLLPLAAEIQAKSGEVLTVGYWRSTTRILVSTFGFSEEIREKLGTQMRTCPADAVPSMAQKDTLHEDRYRYLMDAFTGIISSSDLHYYKLTAAIAEMLLGELEQESFQKFIPNEVFSRGCFDGIMYPSIPAAGNHHCYAIRPKIIDSCFELFRVEVFRVEAATGCPDYLVPLRTGFPASDGTIVWGNRFEARYKVQVITGTAWVSHEDNGFRITDYAGKDSIGF